MYKLRWQKWIVVLLVVLCMTMFFACTQEEPTQGLVIEEDEVIVEDLTQQEIDRLATTLYEVMEQVAANSTSLSPQTLEEQLQKYATIIAQEVAGLTPTQEQYTTLMSALQRYLATENLSKDILVNHLYFDLVVALDKDKCGILAHGFLLRYCDYQVQQYQQVYEEFGYDAFFSEANRYRQKYQVLSTRLDPADLATGINTYYIVKTLCSMKGQANVDSFLTVDEMLMLLKAQNCTAIELDNDVWYELLTLSKDFVTDKYYGKIVDAAMNNGDFVLLAEGMNDMVALVRHIQMTISAKEVQDIQQGKPIANVILSLLEDDQLRQIDAWLSREWHYTKYNDLAKKQYGSSYQQFVQQAKTVTLDQLLEERRNAPDAGALIVGYLAGKSTALAWEVKP